MKLTTGAKILAIDDTPSNLIALESVFSGSKYKLIEAQSGLEALEILQKQNDIVLVLLDVQMPEMDGFETALRIKKIEGCSDIPIIFITAVHNEYPFVKRGFEAGAIDYFSKPFDPEILRMKVDMYSSFRQKSFLLKERENRIQETEELLKAGRKLSEILESLTVGVLIADVDGKICQSNESVSKIMGTTDALDHDLYGAMLGWWDKEGHVFKNDNGVLIKALKQGITTHNHPLTLTSIDGVTLKILASASPLRGNDNHIVGAVIVIQDVTETKRIEEDFEDKLSRLISIGFDLEHNSPH